MCAPCLKNPANVSGCIGSNSRFTLRSGRKWWTALYSSEVTSTMALYAMHLCHLLSLSEYQIPLARCE